MKHLRFHSIILGICLSLLIANITSTTLSGAPQKALPAKAQQKLLPHNHLKITEVNTSWFPMVKVTVSSEKELTDEDDLTLFVNNKEIKVFKSVPSTEEKNGFSINWLSSISTEGTQNFTIKLNSNEVSNSFSSFKSRLFGTNIQQIVKIKTIGPNNRYFPCKIVALHENGEIFEDISTAGGYGRLGSGFAIPAGNMMVELRLLSPEIVIDHFKAFVKASQPTSIERTFGFFKLPLSELSRMEKLKIQIEIEGKRFRFPSIHSNLFVLYSKLAPVFPDGVIPLPEGEYIIGLLPATSNSKQKSEKYSIQIVEGTTIELDKKNLLVNGEKISQEENRITQ
jgi:hypothetical protein